MNQTITNYQAQHESWLNVGKAFLKCQRIMNSLLADLDITIAQHEILLTLGRNGLTTSKELSEKLLVVKSNVSNLIKKLDQRGLITITQCTNDRRSKYLELTSQGKELVRQSTNVQKKVVTTMMQGVDPADLQATNRVISNALRSLDTLIVEKNS